MDEATLKAQVSVLRPRAGDTVILTTPAGWDDSTGAVEGAAHLLKFAINGHPGVSGLVLPEGWHLDTARRRWRRRAHERRARKKLARLFANLRGPVKTSRVAGS